MKKSKKQTVIFVESFNDEFKDWALKNILTNPANMLWNIADLYAAAADDSRQDLKDAAERLRGMYDEETRRKLPPILCFSPSDRIWHLSNIVSNPACLVYNVARLYHDAADGKRADLMATAYKLEKLAEELAQRGAA